MLLPSGDDAQAQKPQPSQEECRGFGGLVRQGERQAGIIGKGEKRRIVQATGDEGAKVDSRRRELLNRVVIVVCRVEIARAVKCQAEGPFNPVLAKSEPTPLVLNFSIVLPLVFAA